MQMLRKDLRFVFGSLLILFGIIYVVWQSNKSADIKEILSSYISNTKSMTSTTTNIETKEEQTGSILPAIIPPEENLKFGPPGESPPEQEFERLWNYIYKIQYQCQKMETLGGRSYGDGDGAYPLCIEPQFWKGKTDDYQCLLYSFGVGGDFSFDDLMAKKGCEVHAFDPTTDLADGFKRESGVLFHKIGIGSKDEEKDSHGWKMRTLRTILKELGHSGRYLDYLKVDIDSPGGGGFEDEVIQEMLDTGLFKCVRQFALEIHLPGPIVNPKWLKRCRLFYSQLTQLNDRKYRLFQTTDNVRAEKILRKNPNFSQSEKKGRMVKEGGTVLWEVAFVNFEPEACHP